jgi:hypothetical protein
MSDTPRTDDQAFNVYAEYAGRKKLMESDLVEAELARELERELNAAKQERADFGALVDKLERECNAAVEALELIAKLYENPEPPTMHELSARAYDMRCIARGAISKAKGEQP